MKRSRTLVNLVAALAFTLPACSGAPNEPTEPWYEATRDVTGPQVSEEWVRNLTVRGVHLGMSVEQAGAILGKKATVVSFGQPPESMSRKPFRKQYSAIRFSHPENISGDLATILHRWGQPGNEAVAVYSSNVNGIQVVTGIDYYFVGTPSASSGLGTPTKTVLETVDDMEVPTYIFAAEPDLELQDSLTFLDACNEEPVGHFPAATFSCDVQGRPKKAFLFIRSGPRGLSLLKIRDASVARASLKKQTGNLR